ncbi:UDP-glucuronosyl/UDP-glucosyltransferase [Trinorchestia longiramus]|nr:UDP-glucuronosyl/UDP-glucosyltransferase [Trinorchestia longiramus]
MAGRSLPEYSMFDMNGLLGTFIGLSQHVNFVASTLWSNDEVLDLWEKRNTFDAFIMAAYVNEMAMPFLMNFTGEFILISNPGLEYLSTAYSGNWLPPSIVPLIYLPYDENMTFFERVINVLALPTFYYCHYWFSVDGALAFLKLRFPELEDFRSYYDRASLTLINGESALDAAVPLLPNQVLIGTLNCRPPQPLPQDLESFMSSSGEHGVIYFSIGSVARSFNIPTRAKLEMLEAFRRLPQKVLWKYEKDDLDVPPNVLIMPWVPQQDILGHPKTRIFITQGGVMSIQELQYHGVPALVVPIVFDQYSNAVKVVRKNLGLQLDWYTVTADQIVESINTLVNDSSYAERLRKLSAVLQDQKETPAERAVWWIEYVIRHQGAPHLQYPGKKLHFLQYICADVMLFLTVCLYVFYRVTKKLLLFVIGLYTVKETTSKQKQA